MTRPAPSNLSLQDPQPIGDNPPGIGWRIWLTTLVGLGLILLLGGWISGGKSGVEKTLIRLVQPVGLFWVLFTTWCIVGTLREGLQRRWPSWSAWLLFMVLTTTPLSEFVVRSLDADIRPFNPGVDEPLDNLVVLGGGTHQGPGRAELGGDGDRVMYAAELYFQGHTRRLTTTGDATPGVSRDVTSPREQTLEIWQKLRIPAEHIDTIAGINTSEEMNNLKENWARIGGERVGLLTSATHLARAMRLARSRGLDLIPVAADHDYANAPWSYLDFIPSAGPLNQLANCQHEYLAWFMGR